MRYCFERIYNNSWRKYMKKIKTLIGVICASLLFSSYSTISALAYQDPEDICSITWYSDINGDVPIEINYKGVCTEFTYDTNMMRQRKTVDGTIFSEYDYVDGRLLHENKRGFDLEYSYIIENDIIKPNGFSYQGNEYTYGYEDDFIKYIYNSNDELIAEYEYDVYGRLLNTLHYSDVSNYENQPENMNSLVGRGYVFDQETGFYYLAGLYYAPLIHRILNKDYDIVELIESEVVPATNYEDDVYDAIINMYTSLINNSSHGCNIEYSTSGAGWTIYLPDNEILSRLIYGECTFSGTGYNDQRAAVAWVVKNRVKYPGTRFPNNPRGVATQIGEFAVISGTANDTENARKNIEKNTAWSEATMMACEILVCPTDALFENFLPKPTGYTNQLFFLSKNSWNASYNSSSKTVNGNSVVEIALNIGNLAPNAARNIFFNFVNI